MFDVMTLKQAADYLQITTSALYRMAREMRVPASKVGNRWRFQRQVLDQWLRDQALPSASPQPTLLVVDDDKTLCDVIVEILASEGYRVFVANSGEKAIQLVRTIRFDVAVVDLKLPGASGVEVLRVLSEEQPEVRSVVITGYPDSELMSQALEVDSFVLLKKPFRVQKLLSIVDTLSPTMVSGQGRR